MKLNKYQKEDVKQLKERGHSNYACAYQLNQDYGTKFTEKDIVDMWS